MKKCIIVSLDGTVDWDVYLNLKAFYRRCGYNIAFSTRPYNSDLLVIMRGSSNKVYKKIKCECHIYDYVKNGTDLTIKSFPNSKKIKLISLDQIGLDTLCNDVEKIFSPHPVLVEIWDDDKRYEKIYDMVHIGHRKKVELISDKKIEQFQKFAKTGILKLYGKGWDEIDNLNSEGPTSLFKSNMIYKKSRSAVGSMHPYQRGKTISGRFWQAPINGCFLYSESLPDNFNPPGVIQVNDYFQILNLKIGDSRTVAIEAKKFWNKVTVDLATNLDLSYDQNINIKYALLWHHILVSLGMQRIYIGFERRLTRILNKFDN